MLGRGGVYSSQSLDWEFEYRRCTVDSPHMLSGWNYDRVFLSFILIYTHAASVTAISDSYTSTAIILIDAGVS